MSSPQAPWALEVLPLGGAREIGASATLVTSQGMRVLVDAGARPGRPGQGSAFPRWDLLQTGPPLQAVILTHGHYDHIGGLVDLHRRFPAVPIFATHATIDIARLMLADGMRIAEREGGSRDGASMDDVHHTLAAMRTLPVGASTAIASSHDGTLYVTAARAGHIPGAVSLLFESFAEDGLRAARVVLTGDVSVRDQATLSGADLVAMQAWRPDLVVSEGTYGASRHRESAFEEAKFLHAIGETVRGGGTALIPAFAIGRAQNVLALLREAIHGERRWAAHWPEGWDFPPVPVWVDGLCRDAGVLMDHHRHLLSPRWRARIGEDGAVFDREGSIRMVRTADERARLCEGDRPAVIVSSSGMLTGGASVVYAKALAADRSGRHGIFLCGYVDEESPGALLRDAARGGVRRWRLGEETVEVHCRVDQYSLSAHADGKEMADLLATWGARRIALVHGDPERLEEQGRALGEDPRFAGVTITIPGNGQRIVTTAQERGAVGWPQVGQTEWGMHWLVGRLLDDGEPGTWHGRLTRPAFWGSEGGEIAMDVHPGSAAALPASECGPRAEEHKLAVEAASLRGRGGAVRRLGERAILTAESDDEGAPTLTSPRVALHALAGRGVRSPDEGGHRSRVRAWGLQPGDLVVGVQGVGDAVWVFPAIVLGMQGAHVRCFAPQGADTVLPAWQLLTRVGGWPLWRGATSPMCVADWELLDAMAEGLAADPLASESDPLRVLWGMAHAGTLRTDEAAGVSLLMVDTDLTPERMSEVIARAGVEDPEALQRRLVEERWGRWVPDGDGRRWVWGTMRQTRWPGWPLRVVEHLESAYREARHTLESVGLRRGALRGGRVGS